MAPRLKVPLALNEKQELVSIENAEKGNRYFCPSCSVDLVLKRGEVKIPHFAHKPSEICNQETIIHKTAKALVQQAVVNWKTNNGQAPVIERTCQICNSPEDQPLPDKVETATVEYRLPEGYIADVALLVNGLAEAVIEIRVTHAVGETKAGNLSVPFIEVDGYAILENPLKWKPIVDHFNPLTCASCKDNFKRFQVKTRQIAQQTHIELPTTYYRYAPTECWKCRKEILAFTWPDHTLWDKKPPSKQPIPKTISYRFTKDTGEKYWTNTCPYCNAVQGDWFLNEVDGPFFGLKCGDDSPTDFHHDLMVLAHTANYNKFL